MSNDWIEHNGGPQPVGDDVWICIDAMPEEMEEVGAGYARLPKQVGSWKHVTGFFVLNQHLIDAARLEGIRLGLMAAMKTVCSAEVKASPEAGVGIDSLEWGRFAGLGEATDLIRALNSDTIAREAVLIQLTREAQGMGYAEWAARKTQDTASEKEAKDD